MLLGELDELLHQMRVERLFVVTKIDYMERLLKLFDRNGDKVFQRKVVERLKDDGGHVAIGRHQSCCADLIVEALLHLKAIALEKSFEDRTGIRLGTIRGKRYILQIVQGNHFPVSEFVTGVYSQHYILRELRHKLYIVEAIHLATEDNIELTIG